MAKPKDAARRAEKKERARQAKLERQRALRRARLRRHARRAGFGVLGLAVLLAGVGVWWALDAPRREARARIGELVVTEPDFGRRHVASTTRDPAPTSGDHLGAPVCGVRFEPVGPDEQIHALEHGALAFQYRPDDLSEADVAALEGLVAEYGTHVLVAPNPRLDSPVVATAWRHKMRLQTVNLDHLRDFATLFHLRGPESAPC